MIVIITNKSTVFVVNLCVCVSIMMTSKASQLGRRGFANFPVSAELKAALEEMVTQRDSAWIQHELQTWGSSPTNMGDVVYFI